VNLPLLPMCLLFAVIGTIEDYTVGLYYRAISEKRAVRSAVISGLHTILAVFVVASVIASESPWPLLAYAFGGGIGTYCAVNSGRKH
jgi:hypothetical protein